MAFYSYLSTKIIIAFITKSYQDLFGVRSYINAKNLGTSDEISKMYGTGTNVDQLVSTSAELTYNVPHWKLGVEYNLTSAWYGSMKSSNGKIIDTHSISNNRLVATVLFMF